MAQRNFHGRGPARGEDAQGTPTQIHISPSILQYMKKKSASHLRRSVARLARVLDAMSVTSVLSASSAKRTEKESETRQRVVHTNRPRSGPPLLEGGPMSYAVARSATRKAERPSGLFQLDPGATLTFWFCRAIPLSSECGIYMPVQPTFWPWLSGERPDLFSNHSFIAERLFCSNGRFRFTGAPHS